MLKKLAMQTDAEEVLHWTGDPRNTGVGVEEAQSAFAERWGLSLSDAMDYLAELAGEEN